MERVRAPTIGWRMSDIPDPVRPPIPPELPASPDPPDIPVSPIPGPAPEPPPLD
jgi:hypothetical protein